MNGPSNSRAFPAEVSALRAFGSSGDGVVATSTSGLAGRVLALVIGLREGLQPVELSIDEGLPEIWRRRFGSGRTLTSSLRLDQHRLVEQVGPLSLVFDYLPHPQGASARLNRIGIGGRTVCPRRLVSIACDTVRLGRCWRTTVAITLLHPSIGLVVYTADLEPR